MGRIRHLLRWDLVAKQTRWKRAPPVDLPSAASNCPPLVARWHAHRVQRSKTGGALPDLCRPGRGWSPGATHVWGKRTGSNLVKRWKCAHVRNIADQRQSRIGKNNAVGPQEQGFDPGCRLTRNLLPSMVSGWTLRGCPHC